jgi:predicted dehydrogenase
MAGKGDSLERTIEPVRVAVIGAGLIGKEHLKFIGELDAAKLVALADVSSQAAALADRLQVPYFTDYGAMLHEIRPEAAVVALPNALHLPAALCCIRAGIPALVEKPIADNLHAAMQLVRASEQAGVPILVGHQRRHSPDIQRARKIVQDGQLGELVALNGIWFLRKHRSYFDAAWRREPGGGPFLINLIHDIDCFRYICGEIESVQAVSSNRVRGFLVADTAALILRFSNGALGSMVLSDAVPSPWAWDIASGQAPYFPCTPADCYYIGGTRASLAVPSMTLYGYPNDGDWRDPVVSQRLPLEQSNCYLNELRHLVDIVRNRTSPICDARDGMLTLAATLAVDVAAREGRPVLVAELLDSVTASIAPET